MRFGICNEIFQGWKVEEAIGYARRAGYDAIEIAPFTLANDVTDISKSRRRAIREEAANSNIAISGLH